jgi:hypothetical protein
MARPITASCISRSLASSTSHFKYLLSTCHLAALHRTVYANQHPVSWRAKSVSDSFTGIFRHVSLYIHIFRPTGNLIQPLTPAHAL